VIVPTDDDGPGHPIELLLGRGERVPVGRRAQPSVRALGDEFGLPGSWMGLSPSSGRPTTAPSTSTAVTSRPGSAKRAATVGR